MHKTVDVRDLQPGDVYRVKVLGPGRVSSPAYRRIVSLERGPFASVSAVVEEVGTGRVFRATIAGQAEVVRSA